jgi:hypothetical protein
MTMSYGRTIAVADFVKVGEPTTDVGHMRAIMRTGIERQLQLAKSSNGNRVTYRSRGQNHQPRRWWTESAAGCRVRLRYGCAYIDDKTIFTMPRGKLVEFFNKVLRDLDAGALDADIQKFVKKSRRRGRRRAA